LPPPELVGDVVPVSLDILTWELSVATGVENVILFDSDANRLLIAASTLSCKAATGRVWDEVWRGIRDGLGASGYGLRDIEI
jgi:hypothetical protein